MRPSPALTMMPATRTRTARSESSVRPAAHEQPTPIGRDKQRSFLMAHSRRPRRARHGGNDHEPVCEVEWKRTTEPIRLLNNPVTRELMLTLLARAEAAASADDRNKPNTAMDARKSPRGVASAKKEERRRIAKSLTPGETGPDPSSVRQGLAQFPFTDETKQPVEALLALCGGPMRDRYEARSGRRHTMITSR
ncbi:unnamed protein product [Tilletia laevis]|nr:hypothetical protein CF336_g4886 [Tilletia laevis]KAE8200562.1 hypothetical protein CF335_g3935 [Tilletia laevis]CAD6902445.1 unnamed protein product [Tilletia laevis]